MSGVGSIIRFFVCGNLSLKCSSLRWWSRWLRDEKVGIHTSFAPSLMPCSTAYRLRPPVVLFSGTPDSSVTLRCLKCLFSISVTGVAE